MTFSIDNPRGVATTSPRKICLGKTLRRTRVKEGKIDHRERTRGREWRGKGPGRDSEKRERTRREGQEMKGLGLGFLRKGRSHLERGGEIVLRDGKY